METGNLLYTEDDMRAEISRLRAELNTLKRAVSERAMENTDLKREIIKSQEVLVMMNKTLDELTAKLGTVETDLSETARDIREDVHDELTEVARPALQKLDNIDESIKGMDYEAKLKDISGKVQEVAYLVDERVGKGALRAIFKKVEVASAFMIVNMVGTVILLGLMCYFVISIS